MTVSRHSVFVKLYNIASSSAIGMHAHENMVQKCEPVMNVKKWFC